MSDNGTTHWETCWRDPKHHACAVTRLEDQAERIAELERERDALARDANRMESDREYNADLVFARDAEIRRLRAIVKFYEDIRRESRGVSGYHLNGDVAEWDEFDVETLAALDAEVKP